MRRPDRRPKIISTRTTRRARVGREPGRASSHHVTHLVNGERGETELPVRFRTGAAGITAPDRTAPDRPFPLSKYEKSKNTLRVPHWLRVHILQSSEQ